MATSTQASAARTSRSLAVMSAKASTSVTRLRNRVMDLRLAIGTLGGVFVIKKVTDLAATFEKSLANIDTLLDTSGVKIERYRDQLVELSQRSSKDILDLSKALYQTISAGIPAIEGAAGAFATLDAAQKAAVAGLSSTEDAVNALVTVVNAYGSENITAAEASDKLLKTVQLGRTTFPQLAHAIGRVAPMAAKFNVEADDMLGVLVQLTRSGLNTNEAVTALRSLIKSLAKPTKQTNDALAELNKTSGVAAVEFSATAMKTHGLIGQLERLTDATGGSVGMLTRLFPNVRAVLPAIIAVGTGIHDTRRFSDELAKSLGTTEEAGAKIAVTFKEAAAILKSQWEAVLIIAGTRTLPLLKEKLKDFGDYIIANQKEIGNFFEGLVRTVSALVKVFTVLAGPVTKLVLVMFAGKAIRAFNALLIRGTVAVTAWGAASAAAFSRAATSAQFAMATGGGAVGAGRAWAGGFVGGMRGGIAANSGAMKRIMGKLPGYMGIVAIGVMIGQMLGKAIGKGLVNIFDGPEMREAQRQAAEAAERLQTSVTQHGFASTKAFRETMDAEGRGESIRLTGGIQGLLKNETKLSLTDLFESTTLENLLLGDTKTLNLFDSDIGEIQPLIDKMKDLRKDLSELTAGRNVLTDAQKVGRDVEIKAARRSLGLAQNNLEGKLRASKQFRDAEKRREKDGLNSIIGDFKTQADQFVNVQEFMASQKKLRILKGQKEESASHAVRIQGIMLYERQLLKFQRKLESIKPTFGKDGAVQDLGDLERAQKAYVQFSNKMRGKHGKDREKQRKEMTQSEKDTVHSLRSVYLSLKKAKEVGLPGTIKRLKLQIQQLSIAHQINRAQQQRAEIASRAAALQKIANAREAAEKRRAAALERLARAEEAIRKRQLALVTRKNQLTVRGIEDQIRINQGATSAESIVQKKVKLLKKEIVLVGRLMEAKSKLMKSAQAEAVRAAKQASRRTIEQVEKLGKLAKGKARADVLIAKQKTALAAGLALTRQETNANVTKVESEGAKKVGQLRASIERLVGRDQRKNARDAAKSAKDAARKAQDEKAKLKRDTDLFFRDDEERQRLAARYAQETGKTEAEAKEKLFLISKKTNTDNRLAVGNALRGVVSAARLANSGKKFMAAMSAGTTEMAEALVSVSGSLIGLDFTKAGESLKKSLMGAATSFIDVIELFTADLANVLGASVDRWIQESGAANKISEVARLTGGSVEKGVEGAVSMIPSVGGWSVTENAGEKAGDAAGRGVASAMKGAAKFVSGAVGLAFKIGADGITKALRGFVAVLGKVLSATVGPLMQALDSPLKAMMGGLGDAVGILTTRKSQSKGEDEERAARNEEYRSLLSLEREATLRRLEQEGATNEEVARAQSEFAQRLEAVQDKEEATPADAIENAFNDAIAMSEAILAQLPALIETFMVQLADKLPVLIGTLFKAFSEGIRKIAEHLGPILTNTMNAIFDALPDVISALVDAIPMLVSGILDGIVTLIERLPDFIGPLLDGAVSVIDKLLIILAEKLPDIIGALVEAAPEIIAAIIMSLPGLIGALLKGVALIVYEFVIAIPSMIKKLGIGLYNAGKVFYDWCSRAGSYIYDIFAAIWDSLSGGVSSAWDATKGYLGFHQGGVIPSSGSNKGLASRFRDGGVNGYNVGGMVSGAIANNYKASLLDNVPALLQSGEGVLNRRAMANIGGAAALAALNGGDSSSQPLNVNIGLTPNEGGLLNAAAALLPFLLSGVSADITDSTGKVRQAIDTTSESILGFRGVPGRSS